MGSNGNSRFTEDFLVAFTPDQRQQLDDTAEATGLSRSWIVRWGTGNACDLLNSLEWDDELMNQLRVQIRELEAAP